MVAPPGERRLRPLRLVHGGMEGGKVRLRPSAKPTLSRREVTLGRTLSLLPPRQHAPSYWLSW
eukprot:8889069-Alexandrium_andersonii.AAC.1